VGGAQTIPDQPQLPQHLFGVLVEEVLVPVESLEVQVALEVEVSSHLFQFVTVEEVIVEVARPEVLHAEGIDFD